MNRLLLVLLADVLLASLSHGQAQTAQTQNEMTTPEFRQVLLDLGSYLDAHKRTNVRSRFEALTDDQLQKLYPALPDPSRLQSAVAVLKQYDAERRAEALRLHPMVAFPVCTPNSIIDNSAGAGCTPAYPDPTNSAWQTMVNPLRTAGAFSPTDYADVSMQACSLTVEVSLQQVTTALTGLEQSLTPACSIIPPIVNAACLGPLIAVAVADATSAGLFSDCIEQDALVNAAEIDAGFHNTVTIYNALGADFTNLNTTLATDFTNVNTNLATDFTNLTATVNGDATVTDNLITADFNALTTQVSEGQALLQAYMKQIMKLELTPDGQKVIAPAILTCTGLPGSVCPNVLANCPKAGCSWNSAGTLP